MLGEARAAKRSLLVLSGGVSVVAIVTALILPRELTLEIVHTSRMGLRWGPRDNWELWQGAVPSRGLRLEEVALRP